MLSMADNMHQMKLSLQTMTQPVNQTLTPLSSRTRPPPSVNVAARRQRLCWNSGSPEHVAKNFTQAVQAPTDGQQQQPTMASIRGAITPSGFQKGLLPARLIKGGNVVNVCVLDTGCNYTTVPKNIVPKLLFALMLYCSPQMVKKSLFWKKSKIRMYIGGQLLLAIV